MSKVVKMFQTEIADDELYELAKKYGNHYYKVLTFKDGYHVELDDIIQDLAECAWRARDAFKGNSNIKTFLISVFRNKMNHFRDYTHIRQRKFPMLRLVDRHDANE